MIIRFYLTLPTPIITIVLKDLETLAAELGTTVIVTDRILIKFTFACADDYQY